MGWTILSLILAALAMLFGITAFRAIRIRKEYGDGKPFSPERDGIDWQKHAQNLSQMIQIPTVSTRDSTDNTQIIRFHQRLAQLYPLIHEKLARKDFDGALLYHWKGKHADAKPILLMSHHDVVEPGEGWRHEPFSGEIAGGKVWGRGTVDTKGALCAILEAVEHLLSEGFTPYCDVYIASSCNEEITGDGAIKTADYLYRQGVRLDLVMDEGGAVLGDATGGLQGSSAMVGIFEKGRANIRFTAQGEGGHASTPPRNNPFARLAKMMYQIEYHSPFQKKLTPPVRKMYRAMAPYMAFRYRLVLANLWLFGPLLPLYLSRQGGMARALMSTTCVFTMAEGSQGANVIPQQASVTANVRFMLHEGLRASYKKLARIAQRYDVDMEMITGFDCSDVADTSNYAYRYVTHRIKETFGDIPVVPYVMMAGTDARHYANICPCVLRFVPLTLNAQQLASAHAADENIDIDSLARAVIYYVDFLKNYGSDLP